MAKTTRWTEIAYLAAAIVLAGGAAFGMGVVWAKTHLDTTFAMIDEVALLALFLGATGFIGQRLLKYSLRQQLAEANLKAAEARFNATFEQFPFSIQIMRLDGLTHSVNRAWEKLFGSTLENIKDINLLQDPAIRESGVIDYFNTALGGEIALTPAKRYNMLKSWPFSGHDPHLNLWIKGTMCPVKDEHGQVTELIIIHEDVTEQEQGRQDRHQSEVRKASIVEAALDCIISMDGEGRVIEWNPSAEITFGYSHEEALGRMLADLIIPESLRERHAHGLKRYLDTGEAVLVGKKIEITALRANGDEFPVELAITSMVCGERRIFSAFLRDLTQAKAAEAALLKAHGELEIRVQQRTTELRDALEQLQNNYEQLKKLEALRDTLTGMVVHDLRTPLNSMLFGLQTVTFLGTVNPAQQECLDVFTLGCKDSLGVINDLLDIGKMESGVFTLQREESDPAEMVKQALERVRMLAEVKNLNLAAQIDDDLPWIFADQEKMGRLLVNLLGNAIKFAPHGGTVTLGACLSPDEEELHFWVRDNGVGIPKAAFERIFEKFGQAEAPLGERQTSSGLGLAFCKMIIEAHDGRIWVESQPGQGSLFTAALPLEPLESEVEL